jgi:hypothetical protein
MPDFTVRSDSINVEQIMEQIRARIREKRGADYTEAQIQELANVRLEKFLDPRGVRSDLLEQFRRARPPYSPPEVPNFAFEENTLFDSHRAPLRWIRRLLRPVLKLFFNPNPLIQALNIQSTVNRISSERDAKSEATRHTFDSLHYEVLHNLVLEATRTGIEVKNLKMQVESLISRLEFSERRARSLESAVVYRSSPSEERDTTRRDIRSDSGRRENEGRDAAAPPEGRERHSEDPATRETAPTASGGPPQEGPGQRSRRRRRRRGRRGGGPVAAMMAGNPEASAAVDGAVDESASWQSSDRDDEIEQVETSDFDSGSAVEPNDEEPSDPSDQEQ